MSPSIRRAAFVAVVLAVAGVAFVAGRLSGPSAGGEGASAPAAAASQARRVLYWHDPMVPGHRFDKPGKSPFMDMDLVPVYADEASDAGDGGSGGVRIAPGVQQNLGLRTARVERVPVSPQIEVVGTVQFDQRRETVLQSRVPAYVERLHVRATMQRVRAGEPVATLYAPEWLGPLNELAALRRADAPADWLEAARARASALSIPAALVRAAERGEPVTGRFTLHAPAAGVVSELGVREGEQVMPGVTLARIAGLDTVWAVVEVPEAQSVGLVPGRPVRAALQADPRQTFDGRLQEVLPQVRTDTRTVQARFEVDNRGGRLVPGMLLRLQLREAAVPRLVVPAEAVMRSGTRNVAIVRRDGGFEPRELRLGVDLGEQVEVLSGLREGEQVVASAQFLVDSEARLRSVLGRLQPPVTAASAASTPAPASAPAASPTFEAQGRVESVEPEALTISHGPVPALKWPAMTMGFGKPDASAFPGLKPGDRIRFRFREGGDSGWELVSVEREEAGR